MVPQPHLDAASEVPLYKQLHDHFSGLIQSGRLARGERLPATRELAGMLGLNRTTVSAAYELLESEGLINGHVGRGSFVSGGTSGGPLYIQRCFGVQGTGASDSDSVSRRWRRG